MVSYDTYALNVKRKLDITKTLDFFDEHKIISTSAVWGRKGNMGFMVFRDGTIWISVKPKGDKLKQTMEVVKFLDLLFKAQKIDVDTAELISGSETYNEEIPEQVILFSRLKEMRPNLRDQMSATIYRLIVHKGLTHLVGDRSNAFLQSMGKDLGTAAFTLGAPKSPKDARDQLKKVFEDYGLGSLSFVKTTDASEVARIEMRESLTASGLPPTGNVVCYLEAGVMEGFFSKFYGKAVSVREVECVSIGDYACTFSIVLYA